MTNKTLARARRVACLGGALLATSLTAQTLSPESQSGQVRDGVDAPLQQYGPTQRTDTLWRIANQVRPDKEVTVYQVMQALYNANPHAFSNANFNSLERNHTLTIPGKSVMLSLPASEAQANARQHDQSWKSDSAPRSVSVANPAVASAAAERDARLAEVQAQLAQQAELHQAQGEELAVRTAEVSRLLEENTLLQARTIALEEELSLLRTALDEQQGANRDLAQQLDAQHKVAELPVMDAVVNEPTAANAASPWSALLSDPMKMAPLAALPLLLGALLFWRRRNSSAQPEEGERVAAASEPVLNAAEALEPEPLADSATPDVVASEGTNGEAEQPVQPETTETLVPAESAPGVEEPLSPSLAVSQDLAPELVQERDGVEPADEISLLLSRDAKSAEMLAQGGTVQTPEANGEADEERREIQEEIDFDALLAEVNSQPATVQVPGDDAAYIDIDDLLKESDLAFVEDAGEDERESMIAMPRSSMSEGGVSAKLDLARAYIEMEEKDSARALLKEVTAEDCDDLRREAETLLRQL